MLCTANAVEGAGQEETESDVAGRVRKGQITQNLREEVSAHSGPSANTSGAVECWVAHAVGWILLLILEK